MQDLVSPSISTFSTAVSSNTVTPVSQKVASILSSAATASLDDPQTQTALGALSEFYGENTVSNRRALRAQIGRRTAAVNKRFLDAFGRVDKELGAIEAEVNAMNQCCEDMRTKLDLANNQTASLLEQTDSLDTQRQNNITRQTIIQAFLHRFTLSEDELSALKLSSSSADLRPDFFSALAHLQRIHSDCKALLATGHQRAGVEIMETMAAHQELAYENLFRWTQSECRARSMSREASFGECDVSPMLRMAVRALRNRPVLFESILADLTVTRRASIVRDFLDALTRGGSGNGPPNSASTGPRPIELHAHDPMRYVGDMMAWLHQAVAGEREMLEGMFGGKDAKSASEARSNSRRISVTGKENDPEKNADELLVEELLDKNMDGTCRPLKTRVEQVLVSNSHQRSETSSGSGPLTAYKVSTLIHFYYVTIRKLMGGTAALVKTLEEITEASSKLFFDALNAQAGQMMQHIQTPDDALLPSIVVKDALSQLNQILHSYSTSLLTSGSQTQPVTTDTKDTHEIELASILSAVLDPLLQICTIASGKLESAWDRAIFMINCLSVVDAQLALFPFTEYRRRHIEAQLEAHMDILVDEQYSRILQQSGLFDIIQTMLSKDPDTPLSQLPGLEPRPLTETLLRLDEFLVSVNIEVSSGLTQLTSSRQASQISKQALGKFVQVYGMLCRSVEDVKNQYEFPATVLNRSAQEVEMVVFGGR